MINDSTIARQRYKIGQKINLIGEENGRTRIIERKELVVYKESKIRLKLPLDLAKRKQVEVTNMLHSVESQLSNLLNLDGLTLIIPRYKFLLIQDSEDQTRQIFMEPFTPSKYDDESNIDFSPQFMHKNKRKVLEDVLETNQALKNTVINVLKALKKVVEAKRGLVLDFLGINNLIINVYNPDQIYFTNSCFKFNSTLDLLTELDTIDMMNLFEKNTYERHSYTQKELIDLELSIRMYACLSNRIQVICDCCNFTHIYRQNEIDRAFNLAEKIREQIKT